MLKKLGKTLTNNLGLKVLAGVCAAVLWVVVVTINDPTVINPYTTSVTLKNQSFITNGNKYFEALSGSNTVTFSVTAKRSIHEKLSGSDFTAIADMERIELDEDGKTGRVPITISTDKYNSNSVTISAKQSYIEVALEDLGKTQKAVAATTVGTVADGCALGAVEIKGSNLMKISGPVSIVSQIDKVVATIDVEGMSTDVTYSAVPVFYDAEGNTIDTTKLTLNMSTVSVSAQILNTKDVTLEFQTMGEPAEGYVFMKMDYSPKTVRIKGEAAVLNPINKITIPAEVLDLTGITENLVTTVDISAYLPAGTSLVLNSDAKVEVTVALEPLVTEIYEVPLSNFTIENLRNGYKTEIVKEEPADSDYDIFDGDIDTEDTISVAVTGAESHMNLLKASDIKGTIDMTGIGRGEHEVEVSFLLDEELYTITVPINVTIKVTGTPTSNSGGSGTGTGSGAGNGSSGAGTDSSSTGTGSSAGTGSNTGTETGAGTDSGTDSNTGSGTDSNTGTGAETGTGTENGHDSE